MVSLLLLVLGLFLNKQANCRWNGIHWRLNLTPMLRHLKEWNQGLVHWGGGCKLIFYKPHRGVNLIHMMDWSICWIGPYDGLVQMMDWSTWWVGAVSTTCLYYAWTTDNNMIQDLWLPLKRKCRHFDEILITGCTGSCHLDNFQCSQWWKFHQNEDISVSVTL